MLTAIRISFVLLVFGFFIHVSYQTYTSPTAATTEGRQLALFPAQPATYEKVQPFFRDIDTWASDRMHYRQEFIKWLNAARYQLGYSTIDGTVVGKDGWLFYNSKDSREQEDARGSVQFTNDELNQWKQYLLYRDSNARKFGSKFIYLMIPNKSTIYSEYLPNNFTRLNDNTHLQQILDVMKDSGVSVPDTRPILLEGKKQGQIYLKNDTHWNMLGADYVNYLVIQELAKSFPDLKPTLFPFHSASGEEEEQMHHHADLFFQIGLNELHDINREPQVPVIEAIGKCVGTNQPDNLRNWPLAVGDCSHAATSATDPEWHHLLANEFSYIGQDMQSYLFHSTINDTGRYSLVMMHDSYYEMLQPFFSNQFKRVRYVAMGRPVDMKPWGYLEALHSDIIIEEILERNLKGAVPRPGLDYPEDFHAVNSAAGHR